VTADPDRPHAWIVSLAGPAGEQALLADCLAELFGPVRSPRFLMQVNRGSARRSAPLLAVAFGLAGRLSRQDCFLPVPASIGRRREDAQAFARHWNRLVGPCTLEELDSPEKLALLATARSSTVLLAEPPRVVEHWA
jgi:hypothetical protein